MSTVSSIRSIENKHDVYRSKDCMKFCESLGAHPMGKKATIKLLTKEQ